MEEATGAVSSCLREYKAPSFTSRIGQGIRYPYPQKEVEENRFSPLLKYCNGRTLRLKVAKHSINS